jgi:sugar (pentulose or hexulose) kinase
MATRLLGIDFGTGGAKACIIDDQGEVLAYAFREYPIFHPRPGWSEHDPETYWRVTCEMVQQVLRDTQCLPQEIAGIAVSSALPSMVLVDGHGRPVAPAINLMDRRALDEVNVIRNVVGESVIEDVTANRIEDHPNLVNLFWYKRNKPQIYDKVYKALTIDGFIVSRLTGEFTLNTSSAVFYGVAFDIRKGVFHNDILEKLGINQDILPRLCDSTDVVGSITAEAAGATGLQAGTQVVGGQVDCNAGWIAGGAVEPGDMQLNLGTAGVLGVVHQNMDYLSSPDGLRMVNIPYTTSPRDTFSAVAVTTTGGQALRYLRDTFGEGEADVERLLKVSSYDLITLQARDVAPGSEGLLVLPYLMGERSPIWDTSARAVMFGLSLHHHRGHVFRAFMEGVAYALFDSYSVLKRTGLKINHPLIFNEGGAKSEVWRRIITDVFGIPTAMLKGRTGAPLGDAILAGVGVGVFDDFTVAKEWCNYREHLEPDQQNHEMYMEYFQLYKDIYANVQGNFQDLQAIVRRHQA